MYNFKKLAQEIQLNDFQKVLWDWYQQDPESLKQNIRIDKPGDISSIHIDHCSANLLYTSLQYLNATNLDLAIDILNKIYEVGDRYPYINLPEAYYQNGNYQYITKKLTFYFPYKALQLDDNLLKFAPEIYKSVLRDFILSRDGECNAMSNWILEGIFTYGVFDVVTIDLIDCLLNSSEYFMTNTLLKFISNTFRYKPDLKNDILSLILSISDEKTIQNIWLLLQDDDFSINILNNDEFIKLFIHCLKCRPSIVMTGTNNIILSGDFFMHNFNEKLYKELKENNFLAILDATINYYDGFLEKFNFINDDDIDISLITKGITYNSTIDYLDKNFDKALRLILQTNDIVGLCILMDIYGSSKKYFALHILSQTEGINYETYNDIYRKYTTGFDPTDNFYDLEYDENIEQTKQTLLKFDERIAVLEKSIEPLIKNLNYNNYEAVEVAEKFILSGLYRPDKREMKNFIITNLKRTVYSITGDKEYYKKMIDVLGNFIYSWGSTRIFNLIEKSHDVWVIFTSSDILYQPKLTSFLQKELSTDRITLEMLISIRGEAIKNNAILPGKERPEELQGKYYPDNRNGLYEYERKSRLDIKLNDEKEGIAKVLMPYSSIDSIKTFINKINIPEKKYLQADEININGFTFKLLDKNDPLGSVLGNITKCCQIVGGVGEKCVIDGYNNPMSGFLAVFEKDRIISQSWLRVGASKTLYLDNIEAVSNFDENYTESHNFDLNKKLHTDYLKEIEDLIKYNRYGDIDKEKSNEEKTNSLRNAYLEWAKYIKEKTDENGNKLFSGVVVGGNYSDVTFPKHILENGINLKLEFGENSNIYSDLKSSQAYKLAFNLIRKYKLF
jgi:hypothetical protein